jgi:hypothetical protein
MQITLLFVVALLLLERNVKSFNFEFKKFSLKSTEETRDLRKSLVENVGKFSLIASIFLNPLSSYARPEGVNRPDLLPKEKSSVIDVANFLTKGQEKKVVSSIDTLQKSTGYKLRVLCQRWVQAYALINKTLGSSFPTPCFSSLISSPS